MRGIFVTFVSAVFQDIEYRIPTIASSIAYFFLGRVADLRTLGMFSPFRRVRKTALRFGS